MHVKNIPWILDHGGIHCQSSDERNPDFVNIGNASLIDRRTREPVPIPPGGTLSDYVPFYFTPYSIMMYNIKTGRGGVLRRENRDIVILVSSIQRLQELGLPFVFTNQHACSVDVEFFSDIHDLRRIDWPLLQRRDFKTDDADPGKQVRYQAEALVHRFVPLTAIQGIGCYDEDAKGHLEMQLERLDIGLDVRTLPKLYFQP